MATPQPINTNIRYPQSPFLDSLTQRPAREWLQWLQYPDLIALNLSNALAVASGGTGTTVIPTNGQLLIGNGTGYTVNSPTAGTGIGITSGVGTLTFNNTGGSAGTITVQQNSGVLVLRDNVQALTAKTYNGLIVPTTTGTVSFNPGLSALYNGGVAEVPK